MIAADQDTRICFVRCGLPGDQCACFRAQMRAIFADFAARQKPLDPEFQRAIHECVDDLYED